MSKVTVSVFRPIACIALALLVQHSHASAQTGNVSNEAPATRARASSQQIVGPTIADKASELYSFERHLIDSVDGKRHYRIEIAIPRKVPPATGFAVLYMLDGNAAMATLTEDDLARLARTDSPVLVAIGYDVNTRHDVMARAYDYTPPNPTGKADLPTPVVRGRPGGGADLFLQLIQTRIKPAVAARVPIDPKREYLWGHSYGGLFTLYTLLTQPDAFARYIAGDPSAWWNDGVLAQFSRTFEPGEVAAKRVAIMVGTQPRENPRPTQQPSHAAGALTPADPRNVTQEITDKLRQAGSQATYQTFPDASHGDMLAISLRRALEIATTR